MVTMSKRDLSTLLLMRLHGMDEQGEEYAAFCEIALSMLGVLDGDGELAPEYAKSPSWCVEDGRLRPSGLAEIRALLPPELWGLVG